MTVALGFALALRSLVGVRIRDRRLPLASRSRLRSIVRRRGFACAPKPSFPGGALRLRRTAPRRLRRLSLSSPAPADWTSAASDTFASLDADAVASAPAFSEEVSGRVASRPGFPLQSPLRSDFRCNPSRLRSLRSLRGPLARRFAALTAACLCAAVANCVDAPVVPPLSPQRVGAMRLARFGAAARPLTRRGGSPTVPVPEPFSPSLMSSAWVCPTARGRLRSHTPRSGLPRPPPPTPNHA